MTDSQLKTIYLKDYQPADFVIEHVYLYFDLNEDQTDVKCVMKMQRNPKSKNKKAALILNGEEMELKAVSIDGRLLKNSEYKVNDTHLTLSNMPDAFTLETEVIIKPQENTALCGLYKARTNFCTQCESHGFRRITYSLDRPDVMSRFTTTITADKSQYPFLLSNGNLIESKEIDGGRQWVRWEDPSLKPCYLFALVAGDFDLLTDTFKTMSGRTIDLRLYLEKGCLDQGDYALASLKRAMKWDEDTWGREYDLDIYMIVAVSDFNMGAMENKGLNIFNTKYILAKPETATDTDYFAIEGVVGHEYFHNWSGNRVTCRDWFQITLKEGLTVFRDQSFSIDMTSPSVARIPEITVMRNQQFAEDAGPMAHPIRPESYIEVNNFYTSTVYRKGSEVIRMVQTLITPTVFRKGMDLYFKRHDGQAVTTEDFIKAMEDASGKDLTQFKRWYSQAGTPVLNIEGHYDESQKTFTLKVKQSCPPTPGQEEKEAFHMPLTVGLLGSDCSDMSLQLEGEKEAGRSRVLEISALEENFTFINVDEKPIPSLLRDFSAPVTLDYPYTNEELAWLFQWDSDSFACWDAGQMLATNILLDLAEQHRRKRAMTLDPLLVDAFEKLLTKPREDLNLLSKLLVLPVENYLLSQMVSQMDESDISAIHAAREFAKKQLAEKLEPLFLSTYKKHYSKQPYNYSVEEMGQRQLKNTCLAYLLATQKEAHTTLAFEQFSKADNMTDKMGALLALNHYDCSARTKALSHFYETWQDEALVVNKWLALQATSCLPSTLNTVKQLLKHPAFDIHNPNNVYALIGGYGTNPVSFHNSNGEGYQFLADQVLVIDKENPQVAARMMQPLIGWKQLDTVRASSMRAELERIANTIGISSDVYEVSSKSR